MALLELKNLHVALEDGTEIVKGVDLAVDTNQIHAIMGPNGSGKSTLAYALMGHPAYEITEGQILFDGEDVTELEADERAQRGLFLAFQYPQAIPGVRVTDFLRTAINAIRKAKAGGEDDPIPVAEFREELLAELGDRNRVVHAARAGLAHGVDRAAQEARHRDAGNRMRILEGEEEAALRALVGAELGHVLPLEEEASLGDLVGGVTHQCVGEGRLAGAVRPHDRVHLVQIHLEVHALDDLGAVLERDVQVLQL